MCKQLKKDDDQNLKLFTDWCTQVGLSIDYSKSE